MHSTALDRGLFIVTCLLTGCSAPPTMEELRHYAATETFPSDAYLDTVGAKRALVIVAHDDDDCAMSGTLHGLTRKGWEIEQWNFQVAPLADGASVHPSTLICKGCSPILAEGVFRGGDPADTLPSYLPIPQGTFRFRLPHDRRTGGARAAHQCFLTNGDLHPRQ